MPTNDTRAIIAFSQNDYISSRQLEVRKAPDGFLYLNIRTAGSPNLNSQACSVPEALQAVLSGCEVFVWDKQGFAIKLVQQDDLVAVSYQGDLTADEQQRFYGEFLLEDFRTLLVDLDVIAESDNSVGFV